MVVLTRSVVPDLEDHGTKASTAPADRVKLLRIVALPVNQVGLVEDLTRLPQADAVLLLYGTALRAVEFQAHVRI